MNKIGSILSLISPVFPSIMRTRSELPSGESWVLLEPEITACPRCDGRALIAFRVDNFNPMTGILVYCATETSAHRGVDLGMNFVGLMHSRVKDFLAKNDVSTFERVEIGDQKANKQIKTTVNPPPSTPRVELKIDPLVASVPVPEGYKNVAWLRLIEAMAIEKAYRLEKDISVETKSGKVIFTAKYFLPNSKEAQSYYAHVKALRIKDLGKANLVGWIRNEEALAVIKANEDMCNIDFDHITFGKGGRIEYFAAESIEARTFKSTTRLLRKK